MPTDTAVLQIIQVILHNAYVKLQYEATIFLL